MSAKEMFDGVIQNYIAEHTTTEKYYTQKYVDEIKEERDKYKIVLDKIKEYAEKNKIIGVIAREENEYMAHILELLEEIE